MKPKHILLRSKTMIACVLSGAIFFASCKKDHSTESEVTSDQLSETASDADGTASAAAVQPLQGFGAAAVGGGNSSTVYRVTNLNSSGAGSLAAGIGSNRTIVFDVSGTINGRFNLTNVSYLTIDATGQNITINEGNVYDGISINGANAHHIILKNLHVTNAGNDGINVVNGAHDVVITNCTSYGNRDGNIDLADGYNITVQYCILGGGGSGWAGDMLITARSTSVHHNLFVPVTSGEVAERCPLVHANYSPVGTPNCDFRNNVVWKWGRSGGTGSGYGTAVAYKATANVVNNYYYSPNSGSVPGNAVMTTDYNQSNTGGYVYATGNVSGNTGVNPNSVSNASQYAIASASAVTTQDACSAAALVLANAGPSPRNTIDQGLLSGINLPGCSTTTPPPANQAPTVSAGAAQTITLPISSVTLTGTASDADGTIASYAWTKVSGGTAIIASPTARITAITGLVAGTYVFNLRVTDNAGATANSNVTVTVNSSGTTPPPTSGTLLYSQGYDVASSVNTSEGRNNSMSTSLYKTGPGSFRTEVRASEASVTDGFHGEMVYSGTSYNPAEGIIEYDVYYQNWTNFGGGGMTICWLPTTSGATASLSLQNYDGKFKVTRAIGSTVTHQSGTLRTVTPNTWYKMRWEVKWSNTSTGYIRLYIDGVLYYSFTGQTADASGTPNLRVGQYRWSMPANTNTVVYYDNLKVYRK